jgi:hypothetical protein
MWLQPADPEPAPADSLVVIDASTFPPVIKGTVEGLEHTVQGPPQAVAVTPDGKLAIVAAPTRYDYANKKELFDNFLQVVDLEASPPALIAKVDVGGHASTAGAIAHVAHALNWAVWVASASRVVSRPAMKSGHIGTLSATTANDTAIAGHRRWARSGMTA